MPRVKKENISYEPSKFKNRINQRLKGWYKAGADKKDVFKVLLSDYLTPADFNTTTGKITGKIVDPYLMKAMEDSIGTIREAVINAYDKEQYKNDPDLVQEYLWDLGFRSSMGEMYEQYYNVINNIKDSVRKVNPHIKQAERFMSEYGRAYRNEEKTKARNLAALIKKEISAFKAERK